MLVETMHQGTEGGFIVVVKDIGFLMDAVVLVGVDEEDVAPGDGVVGVAAGMVNE